MQDQHQIPQHDDLDLLLAEPPKWPKVIGIISIIWGSLGLFCGGIGTAWVVVFMGPMMEAAAQSANVPPPPSFQFSPAMWVVTIISLALAVLLIVAGILTLARSPKGRTMHLVYAVAGIVVVLMSTYLNIEMQADYREAMAEYARQYPDSPFSQSAQQGPAAEIGAIVGAGIGLILGLAWPLFLLLWFLLSARGKGSMKGTGLEPAA